MSSTKQYISEINVEKPAAKNTDDGIRLKTVNHEKFEAVPQLTRGQKPYESVHRLSTISVNTN